MKTVISALMSLLFLSACILNDDGKGGGGSGPVPPSVLGTAATSTDGPIAIARVILYRTSPNCDTVGCSQALDTVYTDASGAFTFPALNPGNYWISIFWTVGNITRNHDALEAHSDFIVAHYSNRTALALGPEFELRDRDSVVSFVYEN